MKKQTGLTLIELMISVVLGLIVTTGALNIYLNTIKSSADTLKSSRLNYDLMMTMSLMTNDIKRAGYWGGAIISTSSLSNPFTAVGADTILQIGTSVSANDCILYSYDADSDGVVGADEYYGFRFNSVANDDGITVGRIQMRLTNISCTGVGTGSWQSITDENMVNITSVQFSFAPFDTLTGTSRCLNDTQNNPATNDGITDALTCANPSAPASGDIIIQKRMVNVQILGQLIDANNVNVAKTLNETIKVRNNRAYREP